jgi:23S rRNA (uracil1939-C5)-methyltransferase
VASQHRRTKVLDSGEFAQAAKAFKNSNAKNSSISFEIFAFFVVKCSCFSIDSQMTQTNPKTEFTLDIDTLAYGAYGIGRHEGKAVMVPNTAPGDKVLARIVQSRERYDIGEIVRLIGSSPLRQIPPCSYAGDCGGCSWQHIGYDTQLKAKQQSVEDALRRIGKLDTFELRSIIPSPREYYYRRRIRLQCDEKKKIGFFRAFSHDLVAIDSCLIADEKLNAIIGPLRSWVEELIAPLEYLEIVTGDDLDQIVIVGKLTGELIPPDYSTCEQFVERTTGVGGLVLHNHNWRKTWGQTTISVLIEDGIFLNLDADVFTQVNPGGNRRILSELLAAGDFKNNDHVLELYCGAGNFTLPIAKRVREIVAVEGSRLSVDCGKRSARLSGIGNIRWIHSEVPVAVQQLNKGRESFSKIILDPPRTGAKGIDRNLVSFDAEKILYVSCNPTTLARDLAAITQHGYKLWVVQPIDLFPQTFHVETLAVMTQS